MGCSTPDAPPKAASRNGRDGAAAPPRHAGKEADIRRKEKRSSPLPYLGIGAPHQRRRSEEHTSELQSLMRTSYAVFCLKKKKRHTPINNVTFSLPNYTLKTT